MHSYTGRRHENEHLESFSLTHSLLCHLLLLWQFDVRCASDDLQANQAKATRQAMSITSLASTRKK